MKPSHLCVVVAFSYTFLASLVGVDCQESTLDYSPTFSEKPAETYYLVRRKPVFIACEAFNTLRITFQCNGQDVSPDAQKNYDKFDPETGRTLVRSILEVSREEVEALPDPGLEEESTYWCECFAWSTPEDDPDPKFIQSRRANVVVAYLKKKFMRDPSDQSAKIIWRKDGKEITPGPDNQFEETEEGSLVIRRVREADQGSYDCVARNAAARRVSRSARLTLHEPQMLVDGREEEEEEQASADDARQGMPEKPIFTEEPDTLNYVAEGKPVKIFCRVIGANILTFNCNGARVPKDRVAINEETGGGSGVQMIEGSYDVTPDLLTMNRGKYDCDCVAWYTRPTHRGWRSVRSRTAVTKLATLEKKFVREPYSELVGIGDRLDLYCTPPIGNPEAKIRWLKDGNPISRSDRNYAVDASGTLTMVSVRRADAGSYVCVATNPANTRRSKAAVITVSDQPVSRRTTPTTTRQTTTPVPADQPVVLEEPESTYYIFDKPVTVTTRVRGAERVEVRCNRRRLPLEEVKTELRLDPSTNKRVVTASFTVKGEQVQRSRRPYACTLHIWYIKSGQRNWSKMDGARVAFEMGRVGTQFREEPQEQKVTAGETATFRCRAPDAKPPFEVMWLLDGQVLEDGSRDGRVSLSEDGEELSIAEVEEEDAGLYACSVSHVPTGKTQSRSAMLSVMPGDSMTTDDATMPEKTTQEMTDDGMMMMTTTTMPPATTAPPPGTPVFTKQPKELYFLIRDSPAVVTVAVRDAQIISFECNGMRVARGEGPTRSMTDPDTGDQVKEKMLTVSVEEYSRHQGDDYACLSRAYYTNPVTGDLDNITSSVFRVSKAYLRKNFMATPMSDVVPLNSRVELECRPPRGVPQPKLSWLKDDQPLEEDDRVMMTDEGNLVIETVHADDAGSYQCVAENFFARRVSAPAQLSLLDTGDATTPAASPEPTTPDEEEQSGTVMYDSPPVIVAQTQEPVYAHSEAAAELMCEATNTMKITFTCNAQDVDEARVTTMEGMDAATGNKTLVAKLEVDEDEVKDSDDPSQFWCQCYALYNVPGLSDPQYALGKKTYIRHAYLEEMASTERMEMEEMVGKTVQINCQVPRGSPTPEVLWMKNGELLDVSADMNFQVPRRDQLVIVSMRDEDEGVYQCLVKNVAGERHSGEMVYYLEGTDPSDLEYTTPEPEPTAEPEGMGTTIAMENATVVIDEFDFVTMDSDDNEDGMETTSDLIQPSPEPTSYPEVHTTVDEMTEKPKGCAARLTECGVGVTPVQLCPKLAEYQQCVDDFVRDCKDELRSEAVDLVLDARDRLVRKCRRLGSSTPEPDQGVDSNEVSPGKGDMDSCTQLQACMVNYEQTDMNFACSGLETFLRCMDNAIESCGLEVNQDSDTSLSDLADWFEMYCQKVVVGEGSMRSCQQYQACQVPVNSSLTVETLYTVDYWCPHVHSTMKCTKMAAAECPDGNAIERQNVFYELDKTAMGICPKPMSETPSAPPVVSEPASGGSRDNAAGGLTASALVMTSVQLVITVVFTFR